MLTYIFEPLLGEVVQVLSQLRDPSPRFRIYILVYAQRILLIRRSLHGPLVPVDQECHLGVMHQVAVLRIGMADADRIIGDPFNMERHHPSYTCPGFHAQIMVAAVRYLREQPCKAAIISFRSGLTRTIFLLV